MHPIRLCDGGDFSGGQGRFRLFTDTECLNDIDVPLRFPIFDVIEQTSAAAYHHHESALAGMISLIGFEMFRQKVDFLGQDGDLNFGGASISFGSLVFSDEFLLFCFGE
jgi:hypothetical protein